MPEERNTTDTTTKSEADSPLIILPPPAAVAQQSIILDKGNDSDPIDNDISPKNDKESAKYDIEEINDVNKLKEEDDTKLKQSENGTLLSCGDEFGADDNGNVNASDLALSDIQTASDIRFFICGSCKNNPILIGSTPKLLPCLHSFCDTCLQERYEKQKQSDSSTSAPRLKCPSCGQEFLVAANDHPTSGFLNNQFVIESTPTAKSSIKPDNHQCTSCDDKSIATSYCMNCNEWLCDVCVKAHQRVKVTKDHIIQKQSGRNSPIPTSDQINVSAAKEKPLFCKVHTQEQLKLFCANCDKLTCRDCQLVEHKDHRYQFIDEAASKHREILKKLLQYLQINLGLLKETIVDVEKVSKGLSCQEKEIEKEIDKAFQSLISAMKSRQELLIKELKNLISTKQALLAKQKKDLTQMRIILEHNHDFAEFAVKGGSNIALLYSRKVLGTRLHNLNSLKYRQRPLALTDLKFSMDVDKLTSYFGKIGAVYSHEDMQRKIDNFSARTPNSTTPRTMVLSSWLYSKSQQSAVESVNSMNKRATAPIAVTASGYINLSKQGSLGLSGQQLIRSTPASPKAYNINTSRHPSSSNQEMIVLSSSSHRSNSDSISAKKDIGNKYMQFSYDRHVSKHSNHSGKTSGLEKNIHSPYHLSTYQPLPNASINHNAREFKRSLVTTSPVVDQLPSWSNSHSSKNNTIDQLRKMVEGASPVLTSIPPDSNIVSAGTSSGNVSILSNRSGSNTPITVKEEDTDTAELMDVQDEINADGFDEGQNEDYCGVCRNGGQLLCCDSCPKVYHLNCHIPPLTDLPSDSWSCGLCFQIGPETKTGSKRRHTDKLTDLEVKLAEKILLMLFVHPDSLPFHHKVSKVQVPDYYKVITKPMDLMTVLTKMNRQHFEHYRNLEEFISDVRLIFSNCFIYNSADSEVCKMGRRLEAKFDELLKRYAPEANAYPGSEPKFKRRKEDGT